MSQSLASLPHPQILLLPFLLEGQRLALLADQPCVQKVATIESIVLAELSSELWEAHFCAKTLRGIDVASAAKRLLKPAGTIQWE